MSSTVLAAGGLFHLVRGPTKLEDSEGTARKFGYTWTDERQLTLILGHHLLFWGVGALALDILVECVIKDDQGQIIAQFNFLEGLST
ncbi:MAG: hypothetical protein AAFY20_07210 [Cyanobacteria bacterium J06639_14]